MLTLHIPDMNCGGCAQSVTRIIRSVDAGAAVDIDVAAKLTRIRDAADPEALVRALASAGFPASAVENKAAISGEP